MSKHRATYLSPRWSYRAKFAFFSLVILVRAALQIMHQRLLDSSSDTNVAMWNTIQLSLIFLLFFAVQGVQAFGAMDTIALLLGLAIGICGLCALIGFYARRRSG